MEISPIAGVRVMPVTKVRPIQPELTASFDIEAVARPNDDSYFSNRRESAGAEESDEEELEDDVVETDDDQPEASWQAASSSGQISFIV